MMRRFQYALPLIFLFFGLNAQDTSYARNVIRYLTSKKCYGRGYLQQGLKNAENFLVAEVKNLNTKPLFGNAYTQEFFHDVNTFPKKCDVTINEKKLRPGIDFIVNPASGSLKGTYLLSKADSVNYFFSEGSTKLMVALKNKLTFSVADEQNNFCGIEINKKYFPEVPSKLTLNISSKLIKNFKSHNIACYINGSSASDSLIIFSAHYDHLGGLGKHTFFPGANDNASGTSVLLNLIRYYTNHPPKYKTVFLFFAGEEAGLLGSKHFTESKAIDLKKIKFLINLDLLGTGDDGIMVVNGAVFEKEFGALKKINAEQNLVKEIKKRGKAANSDHYWFYEAGVPCFFIYTMGGITAYHDVFDIEKTLPLTDYIDVFKLVTEFVKTF